MTHHHAHMPPENVWEFTILMTLLMSIVAVSIDALLPALGAAAADMNLANPNHAQYLIGFVFSGLAIGQLVAGPLSDAFGRKRILYIGLVLYIAGSIFCYMAPTLNLVLTGRFLQGLGMAGPYVSAISIIRDRYSGRHMARVMSTLMTIFVMIPAVAPTMGQAIMSFASWRMIFVFYALYASIVGVWIFLRLDETLPPERRIPFRWNAIAGAAREIVSCRRTVCYTACMGFCFGSFIGYLNSAQQIYQTLFETGDMFTVYFGGLALVFGAASMVNAKLVEKVGMRKISTACLVGIVATSALMLVLSLTIAVTLPVFLTFCAAVFFLFGMMIGNLNAMALEPMGHIAGSATAVTGSASSLMSLTIGATVGQLYDGTVVPLVAGFFVLGTAALVTMVIAEPRTAR